MIKLTYLTQTAIEFVWRRGGFESGSVGKAWQSGGTRDCLPYKFTYLTQITIGFVWRGGVLAAGAATERARAAVVLTHVREPLGARGRCGPGTNVGHAIACRPPVQEGDLAIVGAPNGSRSVVLRGALGF